MNAKDPRLVAVAALALASCFNFDAADIRWCAAVIADGGICSGCTSDAVCAAASDGAFPICDLYDGTCVECTYTQGVQSGCLGSLPWCDSNDGHCKACLPGVGCSGTSPYCDTLAAGGRNACATCLAAQNNFGCSSPTPACLNNASCQQCTSDSFCSSTGKLCDLRSGGTEYTCRSCYEKAVSAAAADPGCTGVTPTCSDTTQTCGYCVHHPEEGDDKAFGCYLDSDPSHRFCLGGTSCVQCLNGNGCGLAGTCLQNLTCAPVNTAAVSAAIAANRGGTPTEIDGAIITFLKRGAGSDPSGFFIQAEQSGPAIFVQVDPLAVDDGTGSLNTRPPTVGDRIDIVPTAIASGGNAVALDLTKPPVLVKALSKYKVLDTGHDVSGLSVDLGSLGDTTGQHANLESRLVTARGTVGSVVVLGAGFLGQFFQIAGNPDSDVSIRYPERLLESVDLRAGCQIACRAVLGHNIGGTDHLQVALFEPGEVTSLDCTGTAPPRMIRAAAVGPTTVKVFFDRSIGTAAAADFSISLVVGTGTLTVSSAQVSGRVVTLTTSTQVPATGQVPNYTVVAGTNVSDPWGNAVSAPDNAADFYGVGTTPAALRITELNPNIAGNHDLVELWTISPGTLAGTQIYEGTLIFNSGSGPNNPLAAAVPQATFPNIVVAIGDVVLVHFAIPSAGDPVQSELGGKADQPKSTYANAFDTAWDVLAGAPSLTFSSAGRTINVRSPSGAIQDAVAVFSGSSGSGGQANLQYLQQLGQWAPASCGSPNGLCLNSTVTYPSSPPANSDTVAVDITTVSTLISGASVKRTAPGSDTNQRSDFAVAATPSWGVVP